MRKFYMGLKGVRRSACVAGLLVAMVPALALAEPTFSITPPSLDYSVLGTWVTTILGGLASVWVIRKLIKTTNRS